MPEFPNAVALPAAHGGAHLLGRDGVGQLVGQGPAADLGAVQLEGVQAQGLGGDEAVGAGRRAGQPFGQESQHGLGLLRGGHLQSAADGVTGPGQRELSCQSAAKPPAQRRQTADGQRQLDLSLSRFLAFSLSHFLARPLPPAP